MNIDLHPAIVHFPIAWLLLAAGWAVRDLLRSGEPSAVTDLLLALGCGAAIVAAVTGESALSQYALVGGALEAAEAHSRLAGWVAWAAGAALALRLAHRVRHRPPRQPEPDRPETARPGGPDRPEAARDRRPGRSGPWVAATALLALAAAALALGAGFLGGKLVHEHGVTPATAPMAPERPDGPDVFRTG